MSTIEEAIQNDSQQDINYDLKSLEVPQESKIDLSFLKAKTGEGSIEMYKEHPLNFNNSNGMARMLRGLTGMLGALDLAIIDVVVGMLDLLKTSKKGGKINDGVGFSR